MVRKVETPHAYRSKSPLSQAVIENGFIFASGMTAVDSSGATVGTDITTQTRQVMENLRIVLEAGGSAMERVVRTTVFFLRREDYDAIDAVYKEYFPKVAPARSAIIIAGLVRPELLVEIDAIASIVSSS